MTQSPSQKPRILIAGVPFGKGDVGDEALLECVVHILRELRPDAEIGVSTADRIASSRKLNVKTHSLFGFHPIDQAEMHRAIKHCDALILPSAAGLSDYPDALLTLLDCAQKERKPSILFCVGMHDFPPSIFRLDGRRRLLFGMLNALTLGFVNLTKRWQRQRFENLCQCIRQAIPKASLTILRDSQSHESLCKIIGDPNDFFIGADPMLALSCPDMDVCRFSESTLEFLESDHPKAGLCLSASISSKHFDTIRKAAEQLMHTRRLMILGIPMHPKDLSILESFQKSLSQSDRMHVLQGQYEPDEITAAASKMDVVISHRLSLLVLASITLTSMIGTSAEANAFTREYELANKPIEKDLSIKNLVSQIESCMDHRAAFRSRAKVVRFEMLGRLSKAKEHLAEQLARLPQSDSEK